MIPSFHVFLNPNNSSLQSTLAVYAKQEDPMSQLIYDGNMLCGAQFSESLFTESRLIETVPPSLSGPTIAPQILSKNVQGLEVSLNKIFACFEIIGQPALSCVLLNVDHHAPMVFGLGDLEQAQPRWANASAFFASAFFDPCSYQQRENTVNVVQFPSEKTKYNLPGHTPIHLYAGHQMMKGGAGPILVDMKYELASIQRSLGCSCF